MTPPRVPPGPWLLSANCRGAHGGARSVGQCGTGCSPRIAAARTVGRADLGRVTLAVGAHLVVRGPCDGTRVWPRRPAVRAPHCPASRPRLQLLMRAPSRPGAAVQADFKALEGTATFARQATSKYPNTPCFSFGAGRKDRAAHEVRARVAAPDGQSMGWWQRRACRATPSGPPWVCSGAQTRPDHTAPRLLRQTRLPELASPSAAPPMPEPAIGPQHTSKRRNSPSHVFGTSRRTHAFLSFRPRPHPAALWAST